MKMQMEVVLSGKTGRRFRFLQELYIFVICWTGIMEKKSLQKIPGSRGIILSHKSMAQLWMKSA